MTSARIAAAEQSRRAMFRLAYAACPECQKPLSIEHQIERFCDDCGTVKPVDIREGKSS